MTDHEIWILPSSICCLVLCHRKLTVEQIDITCQSTRPFGVNLVNFIFYLSEHKSHGSSTLETSVFMISHVHFWWIGRHLLWNWNQWTVVLLSKKWISVLQTWCYKSFLVLCNKAWKIPSNKETIHENWQMSNLFHFTSWFQCAFQITTNNTCLWYK